MTAKVKPITSEEMKAIYTNLKEENGLKEIPFVYIKFAAEVSADVLKAFCKKNNLEGPYAKE